MGIQFSGLASGLDTDNIIKELMKAERLKVDRVKKDKTKLEWKKDIWKDMNAKVYSFYTKSVFDLKSKGTFCKKNALSSNEGIISAKAGISAVEGTHTIKINRLARGSFLTGNEITTDKNSEDITSSTKAGDLIDFGTDTTKVITISLDNGKTTKDIEISANNTISEITDKIKKEQDNINISFDNNFNRLMMSTKDQGQEQQIIVSGDDELLSALGLQDAEGGKPSTRIGTNGQDAEFVYNGTTLTSNSNEVNINGLTLALKDEGVSANITVNQDTDAIYNKVKDFVNEYNEILLEMNIKVNADRAKGYEPLTQEEKKAMSDDDIKLWEDKIKNSLLRRDDILSGLKDSMRNILGTSSGVDTSDFKYDFLSDLGIVTGDYSERGLLHINGDEDDPLYAAKTNTLKEAIEEDPEKVAELLNAVGRELHSVMQDKMKGSGVSSALTFYNDKEMDNRIDEYADRIEELEDKLTVIEQRYYQQFTAMEKAIQAMNSQSASLVSMLGGGSQ
ncbi:flagellar hook-associated protein 2 [Vallitalea longa]|uniref:Flagellar hook-associated protein 2 n=1 Tax=Vallitalea longa TaxID=2936439 RepID=A0A9W5Y9B9_9FIRM|nr:flagellar filament capping protein FliD [Vallitalea longa]GKX28476.1 flagellar hook-associated protein 2 [Vallitalea longa]